MLTKTFYPLKSREYIFFFFLLCFIGLLAHWIYTIFSREGFDATFFIMLIILNFFIIIFTYMFRINKIELHSDELIIKTKFREYRDKKKNFKITEVDKLTSTLTKYYVLILENKRFKKKFKFDSLEWPDYQNLKIDLMEEKINE